MIYKIYIHEYNWAQHCLFWALCEAGLLNLTVVVNLKYSPSIFIYVYEYYVRLCNEDIISSLNISTYILYVNPNQ